MTGKGKKKAEPTIGDLLVTSAAMEKRLLDAIQKLDNRLTTEIHGVLEIMGARFLVVDKKLVAIHDRVNHIDEQLTGVKGRLGKAEGHIFDLQDELKGALSAIDTDSVKVLDHEKRIRRLEKVR